MIQVAASKCEPVTIPLTAPAGSLNLGVITLKPQLSGAPAGSVSFASLAAPPEVLKIRDRAQKSAQKGQWAEAQRELEKALEKYERDPEAWVALGITLRRQNDMAKARAAFEKATEIDPRFVPPLLNWLCLRCTKRIGVRWPALRSVLCV